LDLKCVLIFSITLLRIISNSKNDPMKYHGCSEVLTLSNCYSFLVLRNLNFLEGVSKDPRISTNMNILLVGVELLHADRQT
jgi:hypothetical protein